MKRMIMIGASGHGKVCADIARLSRKYSEILFLDDDTSIKKCGEFDIIGTSADILKHMNEDAEFFVSIGNPIHRSRIQEQIESSGGKVATLIHPQSVISEKVLIGTGSVVMPGAVINTDSRIGKGVIVNTSSSVDHDCDVGDWTHIAVGAHLCGTVDTGRRCWIGAGAVVSNNVNVCDNAVIGAGAVVVDDVKESGTYIGVPARKMTVCG